jgi:hypothetical protein
MVHWQAPLEDLAALQGVVEAEETVVGLFHLCERQVRT